MPRGNVLMRIAAAAVAVIVAGWFVIGVRQAHGIDGATAIVAGAARLSPSEARRADALLREATTLNPDQQVRILGGAVSLGSGHPLAAQRIFESITRAEPKNLQAWLWLARSSGQDRKLFTRALDQVRRLEPLVHTGT